VIDIAQHKLISNKVARKCLFNDDMLEVDIYSSSALENKKNIKATL